MVVVVPALAVDVVVMIIYIPLVVEAVVVDVVVIFIKLAVVVILVDAPRFVEPVVVMQVVAVVLVVVVEPVVVFVLLCVEVFHLCDKEVDLAQEVCVVVVLLHYLVLEGLDDVVNLLVDGVETGVGGRGES